MAPDPLLIAVAIVLVLVFVIWLARASRRRRTLCGVWACEPDFMREAGLGEALLFIPQGGGKQEGYLYMVSDQDEVLANRYVQVDVGAPSLLGSIKGSLGRHGEYSGVLTIDGADDAVPGELEYRLRGNHLTLQRDGTAYLVLTRDPQASQVALD